jgi:hypothetical protein
LEIHDEIGDLIISFLFQMCQYTSTEENLGLANTIQVRVQLQGMNLKEQNITHQQILSI